MWLFQSIEYEASEATEEVADYSVGCEASAASEAMGGVAETSEVSKVTCMITSHNHPSPSAGTPVLIWTLSFQ